MLVLSGCGQSPEQATQHAIKYEGGDECHLCGMLIQNFPGPKGQGYFDKKNVKFCSTRDMMAFYLDEENTHRIESIFVHDMADSHWDKPDDSHLIDGRTAWYVVGSNKTGAMGPTLASFKSQVNAEFFAKEFGGQVLAFNQLTLDSMMPASSEGIQEPVEDQSHQHHDEGMAEHHHHHHH